MMSSIFYGEIKEERLKNWTANGNPYDIILNVSDAGSLHIGMSPSGKAPDFDSGIRRFKSGHPSHI